MMVKRLKYSVLKVVLCATFLIVPIAAQSQIYLKLNGLYALAGIINPQLEFIVGPHSSISIDPTYSPWRRVDLGQYKDLHANFGILQTEYRFYIKREARGFYVSANAGMMAFDLTRPYLFNYGRFITFEQGFGRGFGVMMGLGIGYTHIFKERWVVDAFFAFDRMWSWYNDYDSEGRINMNPRHQKEPKYPDPFNGSAEWLPSKIGLSIGYRIFDPSRVRPPKSERKAQRTARTTNAPTVGTPTM